MDKKLRSLLSLCQRAGMLVSGEVSCEKGIQGGKVKLVLLSCEASDNTVKKFKQSAFYYHIPLGTVKCTKEMLGSAIGKGQRSVVAVCDENFKNQIIRFCQLEEQQTLPKGQR